MSLYDRETHLIYLSKILPLIRKVPDKWLIEILEFSLKIFSKNMLALRLMYLVI